MNNKNIGNKLKTQYTDLTENIRKKLLEIKNLNEKLDKLQSQLNQSSKQIDKEGVGLNKLLEKLYAVIVKINETF